MNKKSLFITWTIFILSVVFGHRLNAQVYVSGEKNFISTDTSIHSGTLSNGIRYYIKRNVNKNAPKGERTITRIVNQDNGSQTIIIVGDVDPNAEIVSATKKYSDIKEVEKLPDYADANSDNWNARMDISQCFFRMPDTLNPDISRDDAYILQFRLETAILTNFMNMLLMNELQKSDCPFEMAMITYSENALGKNRECFLLNVVPKQGNSKSVAINHAIKVLTPEKGVMFYDLDYPARINYSMLLNLCHQKFYEEQEESHNYINSHSNNFYIRRIANAFLQDNIIPDLEEEWKWFKQWSFYQNHENEYGMLSGILNFGKWEIR